VLEETVRFYRPAAEEKRVSVEVTRPCEPCWVTASRDGVRSVMTNILSNAVKYSPSGGSEAVTLETGEGGASFTVSDHGIGIPAAEREGLFREFFRASNARSYTEAGTGLGLAIVRSLVTQMGGSIEVDSEVGRGTTVRVHFAGSPG
jgi:signal transduction histidine kinase